MKELNNNDFRNFIESNIVFFPKRSDAIKLNDFLDALSQFEVKPHEFLNRNSIAFGVLCKKIFKFENKQKSTSYRSYLLYMFKHKQCNRCNLIWPHENFFQDRARWDKLTYFCKICDRKYQLENYAQISSNKAKYKMSLYPNTPKWLSETEKEQIRNLYIKARQLEKETGIEHDVDHIIPLKGKYVSGLHVFENLRIIPHKENNSKSNYHESVEAWK